MRSVHGDVEELMREWRMIAEQLPDNTPLSYDHNKVVIIIIH